MRHYLLTLLLMMAAMTAMGQQTVSVADARAKATAFLNRNAGAKGGTVTTDVQLAYTAQQGAETYYYVFNNGSNGQGGFVIIGGDETARTILGYSDNGTFDYATAPENMKWWLSQYEQQISAAIKNGSTTAAAKGSMGLKSIAQGTIGPLCGTKWDQRAPYNTAIPKIHSGYDYTSDNAPATGCVATAMAQIMKKYKHPTTGTGSKSYSIDYSGTVGTKNYSANFGSTTYLWDKMTDTYTYNTYSSTDAENAVATLMYHCGVAASMTYNTIHNGGSSADALNAAWGMATYFDYDKGMSYERRAFYTDEAWAQMIYTELVNGRPVLYSGRTSAKQGHSFVCEGYKYEDENDLFYLNWGWSGNYNGYFPLQGTVGTVKALTPDGTGTGGGAEGAAYDQEQTVVIGIKPEPAQGSKLKIKMLCEAFSIASSGSAGAKVEYSGSFFNNSVQPTDLTFGIRLVNQSTNAETDIESGTWSNVNPNSGYNTSSSVTVPANTPAGTYSAYPIYKDENGAWQKMDSEVAVQTITIMAAGEGLLVIGSPSISNGGYVTPNSGTYTVTIYNNSNETINNASITAYIWGSGGGKNIGSIFQTASFSAKETKDVVFDFSDYYYEGYASGKALEAGQSYTIRPYYGGYAMNGSTSTSFQCTSKLDIAYKLSSIGWGTLCLPFNAEKPDGMTLYEVSSVNGNELTKTEATKIEMNKAYLVSGTGTYNFSGPDTPTGQYKNGLLVGNTASGDVYVPAGSYVMQNLTSKSGLAFYKALTGNTQKCSQYKAYLKLPSGLSGLFSALLFTDGTTGIESIEATDSQQTIRKVVKNGRLTIETPQGTFSATGARMK